MTEELLHEKRCERCIRRMDIEIEENGDFTFYMGTLDCPAQLDDWHNTEIIEAISMLGCCSFESGIERVEDCRFREGINNSARCNCSNSMLVFGTCLSKRNHDCCPYELKGDKDES
jgi:hypothetical protein